MSVLLEEPTMSTPYWAKIQRLAAEAAAAQAAPAAKPKRTKHEVVSEQPMEEDVVSPADVDMEEDQTGNHPMPTRPKRKRRYHKVYVSDTDSGEEEEESASKQSKRKGKQKQQQQQGLALSRVDRTTNPLFDSFQSPVDQSVLHVKEFNKYYNYIPAEEREQAFNVLATDDMLMHMGNMGRSAVTTTSPLYEAMQEGEREEAVGHNAAFGKVLKARDPAALRAIFAKHPDATDWMCKLSTRFRKKQ